MQLFFEISESFEFLGFSKLRIELGSSKFSQKKKTKKTFDNNEIKIAI